MMKLAFDNVCKIQAPRLVHCMESLTKCISQSGLFLFQFFLCKRNLLHKIYQLLKTLKQNVKHMTANRNSTLGPFTLLKATLSHISHISFIKKRDRAGKIAEEYDAHKAKWILQVLSGHFLKENLHVCSLLTKTRPLTSTRCKLRENSS